MGIFTLGTLKYRLRKAASPGSLPEREKAACLQGAGDMELHTGHRPFLGPECQSLHCLECGQRKGLPLLWAL